MTKMKIKIIYSNYDNESGISKVTIATDCGNFTGISRLHPEDKNIESSFAGCNYAEMRALIKYMKKRASIATNKIDVLTSLLADFKNRKTHNPKNIETKLIEKQIYVLNDEKEFFTSNVKSLKKRLRTAIDNRENIIKEILEKKKNK